jgi:hypothetical protein
MIRKHIERFSLEAPDTDIVSISEDARDPILRFYNLLKHFKNAPMFCITTDPPNVMRFLRKKC